MKNLLDEIHKLNEEEFQVSKDFSEKVINQINRDKKIIVLKRVTSVAAVACVLVCVFVIGGKIGLMDRVVNSAQEALDINQMSAGEGISLNSASSEKAIESEQALEEASESFNVAMSSAPALFEESTENSKSDEIGRAINEETIFDDAYTATNSLGATKTYSKQLLLKDYINEIHELLNDNNIENTIINETQIEINSTDVTKLYEILEMYVDIELELKEDKIILTTK